ncbi:hypothetical protein [Nostoc sp. 'Peltigera membranacea cyanobiont' 210A]|uniref:hypothetical protein n=1 Tax=Nostoc sp. 'Peltigera membranacea cyanobiont' 210A TaxID=2014529 RepID=UPI00117CAA59|nr:hypothetical protein [Nostoc sp. 'Peltigera membranacea cyanobiont' 210A]
MNRRKGDRSPSQTPNPVKIPVFNTSTTRSGKGFGQRQPTKIDKVVESAVRYKPQATPNSPSY